MIQKYTIRFCLLTILFSNSMTLSMEKGNFEKSGSSALCNAIKNEVHDKNGLILELIKKVEILQAHESDYIEQFKKLITPKVIISINKNIEGNKKVLSLLNDLKDKKITEDKVLQELLFLRFSVIISRQKNTSLFIASRSDKSGETVRYVYGPTNPDIYESLDENQKILAVKAIDKYQTFNRVIMGLTEIVDVRALSPLTKQLLRASPTLWSILEKKSEDFGHPDETFIVDSNDERRMSDWEYFSTHIKKSEEVLAYSYSTFYKSKEPIQIKMTPYERKLDDPKWEHPFASFELPYPDFLKPHPLPSLIQDISIPSFPPLKEEKKKDIIQSKNHGKEEETITLTPTSSSQENPTSIPIEKEIMPVKNDEPTLKEAHSINTQKIEPIVSKDTKEKEPEVTSNILNQRDRPRGAIHYDDPTPQKSLVELKGKHLKTLEALFDKQNFHNVHYDALSSLWKYINGVKSIKESSGGSHKELLDQNGRVITGIFAHGGNQTFGHRTIRYIRDALIQVGYQP